jgi:hypothetical protein
VVDYDRTGDVEHGTNYLGTENVFDDADHACG